MNYNIVNNNDEIPIWEQFDISEQHYLDSKKRWESIVSTYNENTELFNNAIQDRYSKIKEKKNYG